MEVMQAGSWFKRTVIATVKLIIFVRRIHC